MFYSQGPIQAIIAFKIFKYISKICANMTMEILF